MTSTIAPPHAPGGTVFSEEMLSRFASRAPRRRQQNGSPFSVSA